MSIQNFLLFAGGIGLFLFGIKFMGDGLELAAGSKLKKLLEVLTSNRFLAVLVGFVVTAVIQSSSATTVMVIGFVNAGLMNLAQAVGVIMGANIGTTVTSVLIALDLTDIAPLAIFIGVILMIFFKKKMTTHIGQIICGFGLVFLGMSTMSSSMEPLRDFQPFQDFIINANNPFMGVMIGLVMTGIIQSSSATIGILQALAGQGLVPIEFAVYVLYGMNIGTCVTALISTAGTKVNSKRAAVIHLLFNVIGTGIFMLITAYTPYIELLKMISDSTMVQISAAHIIFNVVSTVVLFPFANVLVKLSCRLVPGKEASDEEMHLKYLDERILNTPPFAIVQVGKEVKRMAEMAQKNFAAAANALINMDVSEVEKISEREKAINFLNHKITSYLIKINSLDLLENDSKYIGSLFHVVNDIERIGDHALNLSEAAQKSVEDKLTLSDKAKEELRDLFDNTQQLLSGAIEAFDKQTLTVDESFKLYELEEHIDDLSDLYQNTHIARLNNMECSTEAGMLFVNTITDFERVGDHAINIAFSSRKGTKAYKQMKASLKAEEENS